MDLKRKIIIGALVTIPLVAFAADYSKWADEDKTLNDKTRQEIHSYYEQKNKLRQEHKEKKDKLWESLSADAKKAIEKRNEARKERMKSRMEEYSSKDKQKSEDKKK